MKEQSNYLFSAWISWLLKCCTGETKQQQTNIPKPRNKTKPNSVTINVSNLHQTSKLLEHIKTVSCHNLFILFRFFRLPLLAIIWCMSVCLHVCPCTPCISGDYREAGRGCWISMGLQLLVSKINMLLLSTVTGKDVQEVTGFYL